jgi:CBS-domain-containing membrane protein
MDDAAIHERIEQLVDEEHALWRRETEGDIDEATRQRLAELQVGLDQLWDLLRQRKALRRAHRDADAATIRDPDVVENYWQ